MCYERDMKAFLHLALLVAALAGACSSSSQTAAPITGTTSPVTTQPEAPPAAPVTPAAESYGVDCAGGKACAAGLTCTTYYGIAGAAGPSFHSCEIPCGPDRPKCPDSTMCVTIADGPGMVCRPKES